MSVLNLWCALPASADEQRIALVIGVGDYTSDRYAHRVTPASATECPHGTDGVIECFRPPDLVNALNDASAVRDRLRSFGFSVHYVANPDKSLFTQALADFAQAVREAPSDAITIVYFAGHSAALEGQLYLIPHGPIMFDPARQDVSENWLFNIRNVDVGSEHFVSLINVLDVLREREGRGWNLVVLDSCRDNPWTHFDLPIFRTLAPGRFGGIPVYGLNALLLPTARETTSAMIMSSVSEGRAASDGAEGDINSPFTSALLAELRSRNEPLLNVFLRVGQRMRAAGSTQVPMLFGAARAAVSCIGECAQQSLPEAFGEVDDADVAAMSRARAAADLAWTSAGSSRPFYQRALSSPSSEVGVWSDDVSGFAGQLDAGVPQGLGVTDRCRAIGFDCPTQNSVYIVGEHREGHASGSALIRDITDGLDYYGDVVDGRPHGFGVQWSANGNRKEGEWREGRFVRGVFWSRHEQCVVRASAVRAPSRVRYRQASQQNIISAMTPVLGGMLRTRWREPIAAPDDTPRAGNCDQALARLSGAAAWSGQRPGTGSVIDDAAEIALRDEIDLAQRGVFSDCLQCPMMTSIPAGELSIPTWYVGGRFTSTPEYRNVQIASFAIGQFEVTFDDWQSCVSDGGCASNTAPSDSNRGRGSRPVVNVAWEDAQEYARWLSAKTGHSYRLPSEMEWEYAARAGSTSRYPRGEEPVCDLRSRNGAAISCRQIESWSRRGSWPVGSHWAAPNEFGLYDVLGNVSEWVQDCWDGLRESVPPDGFAVDQPGCAYRSVRGGSWGYTAPQLDLGERLRLESSHRSNSVGFRVARDLN